MEHQQDFTMTSSSPMPLQSGDFNPPTVVQVKKRGRPFKKLMTEPSTEVQSETKSSTLKKFSSQEAEAALFYTEEIMERCLMRFVLLGETAKQVYENRILDVQEIELGVTRQVYAGAEPLLKIVVPFWEDEGDVKHLDFNGFPIVIRIMDYDRYIKDPDQVFYAVSQFYIPNPFKKYWESLQHE